MVKIIWDIIKETGWTFEYIEQLPVARIEEYLQIRDGLAHANNSLFRPKGVIYK